MFWIIFRLATLIKNHLISVDLEHVSKNSFHVCFSKFDILLGKLPLLEVCLVLVCYESGTQQRILC